MTKKEINKVLLIYPPTKVAKHSHRPCVPPLGILSIAAVLRDNNFNVIVLDATLEGYDHIEPEGDSLIWYGLPMQDIEKRIKDINPDAVGISCPFSASFAAVRKICKIVKSKDKDIITITGGTHPSFLSEKCLIEVPELDYIIIGEGDYTINELLMKLNKNKKITDIDGLAYRDDGKIWMKSKTQFIEDLDDLPLPARDLVPIEKYISINSPHGITSKKDINMSVMTSRGCPFFCVFCSSAGFWGRKYRMRSVDDILDEIEMLVKRYGAKEIQFLDDNLTLNKERALNLFQGMIDRKLDIVWNTPNGIAIWTLDEDMLKLMKRSGCYALTLAIESGDQYVLDRIIRKPLKIEQVKEVVRLTKKLDIQTHAFFLVGFPGETLEQVERTFKFARDLDLDTASFNIPQPLPGSELDKQVRESKCLKENFDYENIAYLLASYDTEYFRGKELERKVAKEFLKFNLSLSYRHPVRFMQKFGFFALKNPSTSLKFLFGFFQKSK
ncbi:MAG: radical SAM protein [Candidatus Woesearchaeota archaeon]